jgi:hypothetical protein
MPCLSGPNSIDHSTQLWSPSIPKHTSHAHLFTMNALADYHGRRVHLLSGVAERALQNHWDMCCIENMTATALPGVASISTSGPDCQNSLFPVSPTPHAPRSSKPSKLSTGGGWRDADIRAPTQRTRPNTPPTSASNDNKRK